MKHLSFREASISTKLLWITSALFLVTVLTLSFTLRWALDDNNAQLSEEVQDSFHIEIRAKLEALSDEYGEKVAGFINQSFSIPYSFAGQLEETAGENALSRTDVETMLAAVLNKNKKVSSIYAQFEANGYDNLDQNYIDNATHSVHGVGTLEIYHLRNLDGSIEQVQVKDASEKYLLSKNEFGVRTAEWFLCPKETKHPCLMEPYAEEVTPGHKVMMTSLIAPVVADNKFRGVVGIDLNLPVFQKFIKQLSMQLYQGKAKVTLLSNRGLIVAASHYDNKLGRPLSEAINPQLAETYSALKQGEGYLDSGKYIVISHPIKLSLTDSQWTLLIEVPKLEAYNSSEVVNNNMQDKASELSHLLFILGALVSVFAVLAIYLVIRSITSPLTMIQQRVENLASAEGDLTQSIEVDSHAELIALGNGFSAFIAKLKYLIDELKGFADQSQQESQSMAGIAQNIRDSVNCQYSELESVATAVNQMSATALDAAKASEQAAAGTEAIAQNVKHSEVNLAKAMEHVSTMSAESLHAKDAVGLVADRSDDISSILDVIRAIADQTNLLALNAAIEAARAGEQGRGFAVVADEVRALASKTQSSTDDISKLIDALQQEVRSASDIIGKGAERGQMAVSQTDVALVSLNEMVSQISEVTGQVTQLATAAEEQSAVTEDVNKNITGISDSAAQLAQQADDALASSNELAKLVKLQEAQLDRLKT